MTNTFPARRATALAAAAVVAGSAAVTVLPSNAGLAAPRPGPAVVVAAAPRITDLTPAAGGVEGGTVVTLNGTGLADATEVSFGDVPATRFVVMNDTRIYAVAPAGVAGTVPVTVTTGSGTAAGRFGYRMALGAEFDSFVVSAAGNTKFLVTVTGGSLGATAAAFATLRITAKVGELPARLTYIDESRLQVTVPATGRAGTATLQLFHDGFAGPASTSTIGYLPSILGVVPAKISTTGDTVKITGTGFLGVDAADPAAVTFGGVPATWFQIDSATQITAGAPEGADGVAAVRVATTAGSSPESSRAQVTYRSVLSIDTTDLVLKGGGVPTLITITGGDLGDDAKAFNAKAIAVTMGVARLPTTYVDSRHVRVTVPAVRDDSVTLRVVRDGATGPAATIPLAPVVTSLSAGTDTVAGGKTVTVKVGGPGAAAATDFTFGDTPAECVAKTSPALTFVCTVPAATQAGPVWVRFTSGTGTPSVFTVPATFGYTDID